MSIKSAWTAIGIGLLVAGGGLSAALAQGVPEGRQPPAEQQAPSDQKPEKPKCISSTTEFKEKGKAATFEIELQNSCDMRLKCTVDAFVTGSRGQAQGHATLVLAAAPKGRPPARPM